MAVYTITAPDGNSYDVTAPDDATPEQVLAYARANYAKAAPRPGAAASTIGEAARSVLENSYPGQIFQGANAAVKAIDPEFQLVSDTGAAAKAPALPPSDAMAEYWRQKGDYPAPGAEVPIEQRLAENAVKAGNAVGLGYGVPAMVAGLGGLGLKAAGALTRGLAGPLEGLGDILGSWIPTGWKNLPENALKAKQMVSDAAHYAMNPHPEVQQAMMDLAAQARRTTGEAAEAVGGEGASLVKVPADIGPPTNEVSLPKRTPALSERAAAQETIAAPEEGEIPAQMALFDDPIFSGNHITPSSQLEHTEAQMDAVGRAISAQKQILQSTGKQFDPSDTVKMMNSLLKRNASGREIPVPAMGGIGVDAHYNEAVSQAIGSLTSAAGDELGNMVPISWERANQIKTDLQKLAEQTDHPAMIQAARMLRDSIDDQAQKLLAARGADVGPFQQLRDAYGKLAEIHTTLNSQVRSGLSAKNQIPVVRGVIGAVGMGTGNAPLAAAPAVDWLGRKFGTLALARGFHNLSGVPGAMSAAGANMVGALQPGIPAIIAGLAYPDQKQ